VESERERVRGPVETEDGFTAFGVRPDEIERVPN
jgi:hypothetical protein